MDASSKLRELLDSGDLSSRRGIRWSLGAARRARRLFGRLRQRRSRLRSAGPSRHRPAQSDRSGRRSMSRIVDATESPVIADADTGFGNAINVHRTALDSSGSASLRFTSRIRRSPSAADTSMTSPWSPPRRWHKDQVAKDAVGAPGRWSSPAPTRSPVEGFDAALDRARTLRGKSGRRHPLRRSPPERSTDRRASRHHPQPKLINMFSGGKTPVITTDRPTASLVTRS